MKSCSGLCVIPGWYNLKVSGRTTVAVLDGQRLSILDSSTVVLATTAGKRSLDGKLVTVQHTTNTVDISTTGNSVFLEERERRGTITALLLVLYFHNHVLVFHSHTYFGRVDTLWQSDIDGKTVVVFVVITTNESGATEASATMSS